MKKLKRFLALFLVLSMMLSVAPFSAFASESTETTGETTAPVADAPEGETESAEVPEETQVSEEPQATEAAEEATEAPEATEVSTEPEEITGVTEEVEAVTVGEKPANGTTSGQPFASGTGDSQLFRIPAIVALSDGTLVAAADARWNDANDRGNIDTLVSYSADKGATWNYTYANYIADSSNSYNLKAATFIDPALAVKTVNGVETIYMLVDLFPGQTSSSNCIAVANAGTGFDSNGYLQLKTSSYSSSYNYYLKDGRIYDYSTNTDQGYEVDAFFNVSKDGTAKGNLFTLGTSGFYVLQTSYLYLTKSTDGGKTWSAPQMLNPQVKGSGERFYGVGPGAGLVTSTGRIIYPCYTYTTQDGNTSVIYSDDNGATWTRGASVADQTSEATVVEVDGMLYMFTRHGGYYTSTDMGATWSSKQTVSGISYTTTCQLSALVYSKQIDGQTAILLSVPTSNRTTGKIFVGLVNEDKSITWKYTYSVNGSGTYQYSSMAELADGSIGLLYENGSASITYTNIAISDIASGAEIGTPDAGGGSTEPTGQTSMTDDATDVTITVTEPILTAIAVEKKSESAPAEGYTASVTYSIVINGGEYRDGATVKIPYDSIFDGCNSFTGSVDGDSFDVSAPADGYFTVDVPHFSDVTISGKTATVAVTETKDVTLEVGQSTTITDESGNYQSSYTGEGLNTAIAKVTVTGQDAQSGTSYNPVSRTYGQLATVKNTATVTDYYYKSGDTYYEVYGYYTEEPSWFWTTTTYYYGYYVNGTWTELGNSESSGTSVSVYEAVSVSLPTATKIEIEGISPGTTSVVVGTTQYNITVTPKQSELLIQTGKSVTVPVIGTVTAADITAFNSAYGSVVTAALNGSNLVFTGVAEGTVSAYLLGHTSYTISVVDIPEGVTLENSPFTSGTGDYSGSTVTKLTTSLDMSYDLNLKVTGSNVTWSSMDESIATVDQNGTVTGVAVGSTFVTCTVDGVTYAIPVVVLDTVDESKNAAASGHTDLYIAEITNTHVVYSIDLSTDYLEAQEGEIIYVAYEYGSSRSYGYAINFFGAEDEGYALTFMASTNSSGNYYALYETSSLSNLSAYTEGALYNARRYYWDASAVQNLLNDAIADGYDGTMGWTRGSSHTGTSVSSSLTFRSQKLPTVTKEIVSVNGQDYVEGMTAKKGDVINFRVTVTQYATTEKITYTNDTLTETLVPLSGSNYSVSGFLADTTLSADKTYVYDVSYTIKDSDLDTMITNTVSLSYTYDAPYSDGSFSASANASAKITATTYTPTDYVVDFGLPATFSIDGWGTADVTGISAKYADVAITGNHNDGYTISYEPNQILQDVDTVTMTNAAGAEFNFKVYPATTVYYEEGFINWGDNWTTGSKGSGTQTAAVLGSKTGNYGYDVAYSGNTAASNDTHATTILKEGKATIGSTGTFTFTGTGFDLYANCTSDTGYVSVQVKTLEGSTVKMFNVNTVVKGGVTDATTGQVGDMYNLPIVSQQGLDYGTYVVTIRKVMDTKPVNIDGVRIFGTVQEAAGDSSIYYADQEDHPDFYQLRDHVLYALNVDTTSSSVEYPTVRDQIYDMVGAEQTAIILDVTAPYDADQEGDTTDDKGKVVTISAAQDLLDNGPKNELYLYGGQTLIFSVNTDRMIQIGLKAPCGETSYTAVLGGTTVKNKAALKSSVDMFYTLGQGTGKTAITITNTGSNILAVTDLKICDDPNMIFLPLTPGDIEGALLTMGYVDESTDLLNLSGTTMTLGNSLGVNFVLDTSKLEGDGHYAVIGKTDAEGTVETVTVPQSDWAVYTGSLYYFTFNGVAAKEMTDQMSVIVYNAEGEQVTNEYFDSVESYAHRAIAQSSATEKSKTLLVDMLNYGAAAQVYFGYNTADLANADLTEAQQAYATASVEMEDIRQKGTGYMGTTLTLRCEIELNFVYSNDVIGNAAYAVATYTDHYGNAEEVTYQADSFREYNSTMTYVAVTGMAVADCGQAVTLTLYDAEGNVLSTSVDSAESYVCRIADADALYVTIMKFATSAYAYFH